MEITVVLAGFVLFFIIIQYAVSSGIDHSKEVKALRAEINEIKNKLNI
ncbi:hypothetical protein KUV80_09825 [Fictibacillus nanhaiensis]|nr:hypothetical protein [Fictibacillus nanhaiensis]MBY6036954.1 hypothetical protein [Fictibacillus nanhaiensis]